MSRRTSALFGSLVLWMGHCSGESEPEVSWKSVCFSAILMGHQDGWDGERKVSLN